MWLNYVEETDLHLVVAGATAMAFPSLAEGFGLPIIEAFAVGTPVIASNSTSIPEVAGSAAILVSPTDVWAFSKGLAALLSEKTLREEMIYDGRQRAEEFAWETAVSRTINVYSEVIGRTHYSARSLISGFIQQG